MMVPAHPTLWARLQRVLVVLVLAVLAAPLPAGAQDAQPGVPGGPGADDPAELLRDFIHYTITARPDLAAANAQALLDAGLSNAEIARLVEADPREERRFREAMDLAIRMEGVRDVAGEVAVRYESGRLDLARDPARIQQAIHNLTGILRQRNDAKRLLEAAGEYAVPALLSEIVNGTDPTREMAAIEVLRKIDRLAVTPLCAALPQLDGTNQRIIADLLGELRYEHAGPYLLQLSQNEAAPAPTREAASRAYRNVEGETPDLSTAFADLARNYFISLLSLIAYPEEATNNVWNYDPFVGLVATPVPTPIFTEVMAMMTASHALDANAGNRSALATFVAANLKRENDLPAETVDPIYGEDPRSPAFYATVFGTGLAQDVLALALDQRDTPLVLDAIEAMSQTTGGANLFAAGTRQPLLESLRYPSRRVQYDTSLVLAEALPNEGFSGDFAVVPLLASAVRAGAESYAVVAADDEETRRVLADRLSNLGFTVVAQGPDLAAMHPQLADAAGVDLIVMSKERVDAARQVMGEVRNAPKTTVAPVLALVPPVDRSRLERSFENDPYFQIASPDVNEEAFALIVEDLMNAATGGRITDAEAEAYAIEAMAALRDVAISGSTVYRVSDAEPALVDALDTRSGGTRLLVADILAMIASERAQRKLFDAALAAAETEQIELLNRVAESVKRHGNKAEPRHIDALLALVQSATGETAEAAARVHGALDLPGGGAIELIP